MQKGFTLPELVLLMGIVVILFATASLNLLKTQTKSSLTPAVSTLISDIKSQQFKTMETTGNFGIFFERNRYILFEGTSYSPNNPTNFPITIDQNLQITTINIPNSTLVFSQGNGEVQGFIDAANTLTIENTVTGDQKTITINKLGTIIEAN